MVEDSLTGPHQGIERPEVMRAYSAEGVRSCMHLPIKVDSEVFGVFDVCFTRTRAFGRDEQRLFAALAQRAALAIENAQLFDAEQRRGEQFRLIGEVGRRITSILPVDELLDQMVRLVQSALGYDTVEIALVEGEYLVYRARSSRHPSSGEERARLKVGQEGITGRVAATGEPVLVDDVTTDPRYIRLTPSPSRSELAVPIRAKERVVGVLNVQSETIAAFDDSDLRLIQSLADQAGVAIDNARLFDAEQRRAEQFRLIAVVGQQLSSILPVDDLLLQMAELIREALDHYHVGIGLVEGDEVVYRVGAGALWESPDFRFSPARLKIGVDGITGWVAKTGQPYLTPDVSEDPRYIWMRGSQTRSEVVVPLKSKEQVIGVLDVQSDQLDAFDESDLLVLQSLAQQAAVAIENAGLYEQAQQLAVFEERQRLAREFHDAVTQTLFSASLIAEALPSIWESDADEGRDLLEELRRLSRGALAEMRTLLMELRPGVLVDADLADLVRQLGEALTGRTGIAADVTIDAECVLPPDVRVSLYRIAQEALNNIVKHAQASRVEVVLQTHITGSRTTELAGRKASLRVWDDGVGFEPVEIPPESLGLGIMHERAESIGARLTVESRVGAGTEITVIWAERQEDTDDV